MNQILVEACFDGDLETKMSGVPFSTSVREIVTVGEMVKMWMNEEYGKGKFIDEAI